MKITPEHKVLFYKAATTTGLSIGALCTPWETTKIIGLTILTGMGYGVTNDLISSYNCSEHFKKGHIFDSSNLRNQPIKGLPSTLNAVVCGMFDYWHVSSIAGIVLAAAARTPLPVCSVKIQATQIAPYLAIGAAFITAIIQIKAQCSKAKNKADFTIAQRRAQFHFKKRNREICNTQYAASYAMLVIGNALLTIALLITRIGLRLINR